MKIWGRSSAFNVQKVLWTLAELGLEAEQIEVGGAFGGLDSPQFLALNPNGTIPVLEVPEGNGGKSLVLWESQAIIRYLAACFSADSLWPVEASERAIADSWMDWSQAQLQPAFMRLFWGYYRTPEAERNEKGITRSAAETARCLTILDEHLETREFLGGSQFTMGDIPAGAVLYRYYEMGVEPPKLANVERWYQTLQTREDYRRTIMQPFDDLKGRLAF